MTPQLIVATAVVSLAFGLGWKVNGDRWDAKYTALQLDVSEARAAGEQAAREALQEAHRRDLQERERRAAELADALRRARNDAETIQAEADRQAAEFAESQRDPDCAEWAAAPIACPVRLLDSADSTNARDRRSAGANPLHSDTSRADEALHSFIDTTDDKRRPVPAVATASSGVGRVQ